jgi:hypothetical protein
VGEIAHRSEEIDPAENGYQKEKLEKYVIVNVVYDILTARLKIKHSPFDVTPAAVSRHLAFLFNMAY